MNGNTKTAGKTGKSITKIFLSLVLGCAVTTGTVNSTAGAASLPDTAGLVPAETIVLVNIEDFSRLKTQFERTSLYKLYKDAAMADFIDNFKAKWHLENTENKLLQTVLDPACLPEGKAAAGLILDKQAVDNKEPTAFFIIQWGKNSHKIKEAVNETVQELLEQNKSKKLTDYRAVNITTIIADKDSRLGYGLNCQLSYCFVDDCLIASEDINVLKFIIAHIKGARGDTLADESDYNDTIKSIGPYHDVDFYINIRQIVKTIIAEDTAGNEQQMVTNLGFDNVGSFNCSIAVSRTPDTEWSAKALLKINGAKKGICRMLDMHSAAVKVPQFVPALSYSAAFLNVDIKQAYDVLVTILKSFSPIMAAQLDGPLLPPSQNGEGGVYLKDDIIEHFASQIVITESAKKPHSDPLNPSEMISAFAINNPQKLEKSLSALHKQLTANDKQSSRELLGHTIYTISPPDLSQLFKPGRQPMQNAAGPVANQAAKTAFTVTAGHLILGSETAVEKAIRTLTSKSAASLASAKWFSLAKRSIPSMTGTASMNDESVSMEFLWQMIKQSLKAAGSQNPANPFGLILSGSKPLREMIAPELLPEFDAVRKYFGISVFYGVGRDDGFFFESKYLNSPDS